MVNFICMVTCVIKKCVAHTNVCGTVNMLKIVGCANLVFFLHMISIVFVKINYMLTFIALVGWQNILPMDIKHINFVITF